uniref:Prp18 domain-containing protein n=1 Tax=Alexandrium monilatum TaxID=311494 RepID=A0A7S4UZY1_9DINO|mmetsp:Transcript_33828/g.105528  ORF Transcript_33828/g.105528 Transcript_33828/m.105528 type:complete len:653 (+) Transcript_33828:123-2081(+)
MESIGSSEEVIDSGYEEELVVLSITEVEKRKRKKKASKDKKKKGKSEKKDAKDKKRKRREEQDLRDGGARARPERVRGAADAAAHVRGSAGPPAREEPGGEAGGPQVQRHQQPPPEGGAQARRSAAASQSREAAGPPAAADPQAPEAVVPAPAASEPCPAPAELGGAEPHASEERSAGSPRLPEAGRGDNGEASVQLPVLAAIKEESTLAVKEEQADADHDDSDVVEVGRDDDEDDELEVVGGEEALAAAKAVVEAAAAAAAKKKKKKAREAAAKKLKKLEEAAAKERRRLEEERRLTEERAQREEAARLEAQRRAAQEAAGREALRQRESELREKREAELREAQRQLQKREAEKAAMLQAAQRELIHREAERERAKKKAVGSVNLDEAGSFANFGSFNAKRSLAEAHGQTDKKAGADGAGSTDESSNDSEDSQQSEQEGQVRRNPTKIRPPSLWTDPSAALQDEPQSLDWNNPPADLLPREEVATPAAFVEHFARFMVGAWRRELQKPAPFEGRDLQETELAVFKSRRSLQQIECAVAPLIKQLQRNEASDEVVRQLDKMVTLAASREYAEAGAAYITMALGHKKWNQTHATYAGAVGQNKGCRTYRTYQDKLLEYDKDPVVQKYIQCMRKLVHFAQCIRPNTDVAKHLHF